MPLDADGAWSTEQVLSGEEVRDIIDREVAELRTNRRATIRASPPTEFRYADDRGRVGFINSVTQPFCGRCNRLRLTAEGQVRNCLFSTTEWDARALLRERPSEIHGRTNRGVGCRSRRSQEIRPRHRHARLRKAPTGDVSDRRLIACERMGTGSEEITVQPESADRLRGACPHSFTSSECAFFMPPVTRIYLDNAATSWPKPPAVYEAVEHYLREVGAPAGRGPIARRSSRTGS